MSEPGAVATGFRVRDGEKNPVITIPGSDKTNYNVLFKDESGVEADSQITAFDAAIHRPVQTSGKDVVGKYRSEYVGV